MSQESAVALVERLRSDEEFRERVLAEDGAEARLELVRAEGYDCTAGEVAALDEALPDDALESVRGGFVARPDGGAAPTVIFLESGEGSRVL
jgi:predicted ribosomally synthesized peptide with nif11-like leader